VVRHGRLRQPDQGPDIQETADRGQLTAPPPGNRAILVAALPLAGAVSVFGVSFGVLAAAVHTPAWVAVLMSVTVYAGSAQFAALGVVAAGGAVPAALAAALLLNLRFLAVGAHAGPALPPGRWRRLVLSQLVIDESYVLGLRYQREGRPDGRTMIVSGILIWAGWVAGTALGVLAGPVLGDPRRLGLDAAFPAAFVALLLPLLSTPRARLAAGAGAVITLVLGAFSPAGLPLAGAALVGLAVGRGGRRPVKKP
jgi:4-azaleucine resistance transporter AzlC